MNSVMVVVVMMNKRGFDMITLSVGVRFNPFGRGFVVEVDAVLRIHLDGVVTHWRLNLLLLILGEVNCRRSRVMMMVMILRLDDTSHSLRRSALDKTVTFAHTWHRRRLVHWLRMSRRRATVPVVIGRSFKGASVRHSDPNGG
jgi:hypothetical protein